MTIRRLVGICSACAAVFAALTAAAQPAPNPVLLVVIDGLRADQFTPELMPRCYAEALQGVIGQAHHAVLPTVTRVNAASIATGCQPGRHGIVANALYVPELNPSGAISTASRKKLLETAQVWGGNLLAVPTLAEWLNARGKSFLACSSGSAGSATLLNPRGVGGGILHPEFCVPESRAARAKELLGPEPPETEPARPLMQWMTDAYLRIGLPEIAPNVTVLWFTDPDHTGHAKGIGAPGTLESIRMVDEQLGRIFDHHRQQGIAANWLIAADHGFAASTGEFDVAAALKAAGWLRGEKGAAPVVIDGAVYLPQATDHDIRTLAGILQRSPGVGPVFTRAQRPGAWKGLAPGTLSLDLAGCAHPHAAPVVAYPVWSSQANDSGYPGLVFRPGPDSHGATSPWEINGAFAAFGPGIKKGVRSAVPTSNADLAPTLAHLAGIPAPRHVDGRVLREILRDGPRPESIRVRDKEWQAATPDGAYRVTLRASLAQGRRYVHFARAERP